ncbi:MAG: hypothetical protein IPJ88_17920 [Myxococcales bacterium]|nr:MAG: hypothetical protein IPJ88_17920 [Myxococcales bacterium]
MEWRPFAYVFSSLIVALVLVPLLYAPLQDSYPLSSYPMFSVERDKPWVRHMRAVDTQGRSKRLPPHMIANEEVMQAAVLVNRAVNDGPEQCIALCQRVSSRLRERSEWALSKRIEIVSEQFDAVQYFLPTGKHQSLQSVVDCQCKVRQP